MQNLIFFDKEGNPLNFYYNETAERYEGDILFPVSSSDTFKTQVLYLFEKIPAFEYENNPNLSLRKWQLFNEYGFHFYQGTGTFSITKIEELLGSSGFKNIETISTCFLRLPKFMERRISTHRAIRIYHFVSNTLMPRLFGRKNGGMFLTFARK